MTAKEAEELPEFKDWRPSTVRKRISELWKRERSPCLYRIGRRDGMGVWSV